MKQWWSNNHSHDGLKYCGEDLDEVHNVLDNFDRLVQERCNSIANALELHLTCTKPSVCHWVLACLYLGVNRTKLWGSLGWCHMFDIMGPEQWKQISRSGAYFTNDFLFVIQIWWTHCLVIKSLVNQITISFFKCYDNTAVVLCEHFETITFLESRWEQKNDWILIAMENTLIKWAPALSDIHKEQLFMKYIFI